MKVAVVGTGYVGLVTGTCLASIGHDVGCVDVVPERVARIARGEVPFSEPGLEPLLRDGLRRGRLRATLDIEEAIAGSEVSLIAVGTPPYGRDANLDFVRSAAEDIGRTLSAATPYHVVVVKSTVPPGTTAGIVRETIEQTSGRLVGDFGLAMNPEFLREGSAVDDFLDPDRIVVGQWDERSGDVLTKLYEPFTCPKIRTSIGNAELTKYTSNCLLSVLVSFSNEIASICEATPDVDADTVMSTLHLDRRLSPRVKGEPVNPGILSYLRPGSGFGGSCLPKDVNALRRYAESCHVPTPLLDATMSVNEGRPAQVISILENVVGDLAGQRVAVLGLAFKPGTDDLRSSPSLTMIRLLQERGARVTAYDPVALEAAREVLGSCFSLCDSPELALGGADAAVVATAWPEFANWNWGDLAGLMRRAVIVDGRNSLRYINWPRDVVYRSIGRYPAASDAGKPPLDSTTPVSGGKRTQAPF